MATTTAKTMRNKERGMALLLTLFALLLLSAIGLFMVLSSNTETRIDANYGRSLRAYYSARSGLEEVRDRIKHSSLSSPGGLADLLPQDIAGNAQGVLYVLNPAAGEVVDPTDLSSAYFDDDLCHDYNSGIPKGIKCATVPSTQNWQLPAQFSLPPASGPLGYKWIRINIKTNRAAAPYYVDQTGTSAPLDTRVCWDGQVERLSPNGSCDANGMQTVYMLTALAGTSGARKLLQAEVVAPSIRPAGTVTAASMNVSTAGTAGIPPVAIDGRVHKLDGTLATGNSCSAIAALATDTGSTQLEQALNQMRKSIVDTANASCNADGTGIGSNFCTPGLWWVRGTDSSTRFVTSVTVLSSGSSGDSSNSGSDGGGHDGSGDHHGGTSTAPCDPTTANCFTNLNLAAPQLFGVSATTAPHVPAVGLPANATAPFLGNSGNQIDNTIYQPGATQTVANQIAAVNNLIAASVNQASYFTASSNTLAANYGSSTSPAVVVVTDSTLSLQNGVSLSGYGVLVVPGALEIGNATLNWNGIVLVNSSTGHVTINPGASGSINGALLLAPGAVFNLSNSASTAPAFRINYSCEAIDLAFSLQPFKVISTAESSF
jgi:hypothetical protein